MQAQGFVIYNAAGQVLGMVCHINGDRAADKAQEVTGEEVCLWDSWRNATPDARKAALKLGAIT